MLEWREEGLLQWLFTLCGRFFFFFFPRDCDHTLPVTSSGAGCSDAVKPIYLSRKAAELIRYQLLRISWWRPGAPPWSNTCWSGWSFTQSDSSSSRNTEHHAAQCFVSPKYGLMDGFLSTCTTFKLNSKSKKRLLWEGNTNWVFVLPIRTSHMCPRIRVHINVFYNLKLSECQLKSAKAS